MAVARFPTDPVRPRPYPQPGGGNPMQGILQILMQLMQIMMSQFQGGGGYPQQQQPPYNPFGNPGTYGPQNPTPFNYFGGGGQQGFLV